MWLTLLSLSVAGLSTDAWAGSAKAELQQLDEELRIVAGKNAWSGVERVYLQMMALEGRGQKLTWEHHRWGALAAQSRGDVIATWQRLQRAEVVEYHEETAIWLATVEATHGRVSVELSPLVFGDVAIDSVDLLVDPAQQKTVALATATLTQSRTFDGLLPLGRYHVGAVEFSIDGGAPFRVYVEPWQARAKVAATPGNLRLVAGVVPDAEGDLTKALDAAKAAVTGTPGVLEVTVVPSPARRLYADFPSGALDSMGLDTDAVARQVRAHLGIRDLDVVALDDWIAVPATVGTQRLGAVPITLEDGSSVTVGGMARMREAPDRTAPPPGLMLKLDAAADAAVVRTAVLERSAGSPLQLSTP